MSGPPSLPRPALWLGLGGLIPFLAGALGAVLGGGGGGETLRFLALAVLEAYGAVILSFLGAVHWGFALRADGAEAVATPARLGLGVVPALVAWVALLLPGGLALILLAVGVLGTVAVETLAARRGLMPEGYLQLRWGLSLGAALCLLLGAAVT